MKRLLFCILLLSILCGCSSAANCGDAQDSSCTRVLFIGNSYTYVNDLPNTFAQLAKSGGHKVEVGMSAQGGWTLGDHVQSAETIDLLNSRKWNFIVLQEQSEIPSIEQYRSKLMYPAARDLVGRIRGGGATPILFLTWAHREGLPQNGMDYEGMQYQLNAGYYALAQELNVSVAPVGGAWFAASQEHPELSLWQEDGSHPSEQGTYLAVCIFYATIFRESPAGLTYRANLSSETAATIQDIASHAVP